jgi:hypothetical protein
MANQRDLSRDRGKGPQLPSTPAIKNNRGTPLQGSGIAANAQTKPFRKTSPETLEFKAYLILIA